VKFDRGRRHARAVERVRLEQRVRGEVVMRCAMKVSGRSIGDRMGLCETVEAPGGMAEHSPALHWRVAGAGVGANEGSR
jgi:hypothetical protein